MSTAPSFASFPLLQPPAYLIREIQQRIVLLLNHVLQQEPQAMARLIEQKGRRIGFQCGPFSLELSITPAGLFDLAQEEEGGEPDLFLRVQDGHPWRLMQILLRGDKPAMDVAGDVMLAAEVNWLVDHVRWDVEEDLARIMGDVAAHALMAAIKAAVQALRAWVQGGAANKQGAQGV